MKDPRRFRTERDAWQYVLHALITTLRNDLTNAAYLGEDLEHATDQKLAISAGKRLLKILVWMHG